MNFGEQVICSNLQIKMLGNQAKIRFFARFAVICSQIAREISGKFVKAEMNFGEQVICSNLQIKMLGNQAKIRFFACFAVICSKIARGFSEITLKQK